MAELPFLAGEQGKGPFLVVLFFLSIAVVTVWGTWEGTLSMSEEAVLAETAREIIVTGDLRVMHFDGEAVYDRAPLPLWTTALFLKMFGTVKVAAHLPFVLFSIATLFIVYLLGGVTVTRDPAHKGWINCVRAVGLLSAIVLSASPLFGRFAPHINETGPFTFFVSLAVLGWFLLPSRRVGHACWGAGIAGGILCAGAGAVIVIPAGLIACIADRQRRSLWRDPVFLLVTFAALAAGVLWLFPVSARDPAGIRANPLWALLFGLAGHSRAGLAGLPAALREGFLRNLPWSVPVVAACIRVIAGVLSRNGKQAWEKDAALILFAAILFVITMLTRPFRLEELLVVLPLLAVIAGREIARWATGSGMDAGAGGRAGGGGNEECVHPFNAGRIWSFNQAMIAIFCLLILLLSATPLRLHRSSGDRIDEVAFVARELVEEGTKLANFRQHRRFQAARLLFYGNRSIDRPIRTPDEVARRLREDPDALFLSSTDDMLALRQIEGFPFHLDMKYRAGELVLFGIGE